MTRLLNTSLVFTRLTSCLDLAFTLELVRVRILELGLAFGSVLRERAAQLASIFKMNPTWPNPPILVPLSVVRVAVCVVVNASAVTLVCFKISLVEFAVTHKNFYLSVSDLVTFEACFNYLVWQREQKTISEGFVVTPFSLINGSSQSKLAEARPRALSIFVRAFVYITIRVDHLSLAISDAFNHLALKNSICHERKIVKSILHEVEPVPWNMTENVAVDLAVFCVQILNELRVESSLVSRELQDLVLLTLIVPVQKSRDAHATISFVLFMSL